MSIAEKIELWTYKVANPFVKALLRSPLHGIARVGHIAAEFEKLANVLLGRSCGNPALITYPRRLLLCSA